MQTEMPSASNEEKKRNRAANLRKARAGEAKSRRQQATLDNLIRRYKTNFSDAFQERYPHGVHVGSVRNKDQLITQLKDELDVLDKAGYVPIKKSRNEYNYTIIGGGEKTDVKPGEKLNVDFEPKEPRHGMGRTTVGSAEEGRERRRKIPESVKEAMNRKTDYTGEKAVLAIDHAVKRDGGKAVLGDVFKNVFKLGVNYLTGGSPYIADMAAGALSALWYQRKNIAEGWRKMKSWFGNLRRKKLSIDHVADNIDKLAGTEIKSIPEVDKTFFNFGLRRTVIDLIKANSEVAKMLFENPSKENIAALLQKYSGNTLPSGTVEACQTLLTKDMEIRSLLNNTNDSKMELDKAVYSFEDALNRNDLVSANAALVPVATSGTTCEGYGAAPGPVVVQGITDEMILNTELYKKLYEEYAKAKNAAFESASALNKVRGEQQALTASFNNKVREEVTRRVDETKEMYEARLQLKQTELDAMTTQYNQASESRALVEANLKNAVGDRDAFEKQFREETDKNKRLELDLQALTAKGEEQFAIISGLKDSIESLKQSSAIFQKVAEERKAQIAEMTKEKEGQLVALKENNALVVAEKDSRIKKLTDEILALREQVDTQKDLVAQGKKLLEDKAKEIVKIQAQGEGDKEALLLTYTDEKKKLEAERSRLESSNADLNKQIATLESEKSVLITESSNYKTKVEDLQAQIDAGIEAQSKLENVNAGLKNKIETLEQQAEKHQADNDNLQGQLADALKNEAANKIALAKKTRENILLKQEKDTLLLKQSAKFASMEQGYAKELDEANKKLKELSEQQETYKRELEREQWWWKIFQDQDKIEELQKNIVETEVQKVAAGISANDARANLWKAMRGDYEGLIKRTAGSTGGAYLVGSAPDWNLQPNERIQQFWSKFYDLSFHPY